MKWSLKGTSIFETKITHKLIDSMTVLVPSQAVIATVGISKIKKEHKTRMVHSEENVNGAFPEYCYVVTRWPSLPQY